MVLPHNEQEILVAGGLNGGNAKSSDIYNVKQDSWRETSGNELSVDRGGSRMVVLEGKVLIFGGTDYTDIVETFDPYSESWSVLPERLQKKRSFPGVTTVPAEVFARLEGGCKGI